MYIVTGASSGIGYATASSLAARGSNVIAAGRSHDRLCALKDSHSENIHIVKSDLSTTEGVDSVLESVQSVEKIKGILHAAGSSVPLRSYKELSLNCSKFAHHLSVHVAAPVALNNGLKAKLDGARILYLDSYSANSPRIGWAEYSIIKAAAQMAARSAKAELKSSIVVRLFPGGVRTPLVEAVLSSKHQCETREIFRKMESEGTMSEPDAVARYIVNLLIDATENQLASREYWDFNNSNDRIF